MKETIEYYNEHAREYIERTSHHDRSEQHEKFLSYLPKRATVLDAGCGSGRDSLAFLKAGCQVQAIDAAEEMVRHTRSLGINAETKRFEECDWVEKFDGIWCMASLLHVEKQQLPLAIKKLGKGLKKGGVWFVAFKEGNGERIENGRYFHFLTKDQILDYFSSFELLELWTETSTANLAPTNWINALFRLAPR